MQGVQEQLARVLPEAQVLIMRVINLVQGVEVDKARQARLPYLARLEKAEMVLHLLYQELLQLMQAAAVVAMSVLQVPMDLAEPEVVVVAVRALFLLQILLL
jgi:hypothetical protein